MEEKVKEERNIRFQTYVRRCKRCNKLFRTTGKHSKICYLCDVGLNKLKVTKENI